MRDFFFVGLAMDNYRLSLVFLYVAPCKSTGIGSRGILFAEVPNTNPKILFNQVFQNCCLVIILAIRSGRCNMAKQLGSVFGGGFIGKRRLLSEKSRKIGIDN
jgi:hypothetical protein